MFNISQNLSSLTSFLGRMIVKGITSIKVKIPDLILNYIHESLMVLYCSVQC